MNERKRPPPISAAAELAEQADRQAKVPVTSDPVSPYPCSIEEPGIELVGMQLVKSSRPTREIDYLRRPADSARILWEMIGLADREHFVALFLNTRHLITHAHVVSVGSLGSTLVHPREVFKGALLANAAAMIVGHNHPSGEIHPSEEDHQVHKRLKEASELLGVPLLDSLIVGPTLHYFAHSSGASVLTLDSNHHLGLDL